MWIIDSYNSVRLCNHFNKFVNMKKLTDILEWPLVADAKIVRGKYYNNLVVEKVFRAERFTDRKSGRYFYDLYLNNEIYLTRVNPLFLDFINHY